MMNTIRIGPPAPGFRAVPSHAEAVALPWPMPQPSAASPNPTEAAAPTQSVPAAAPVVCANAAGATTRAVANALKNHRTFFVILSPLYEFAVRRWFPDTEQPGSHCQR